MAYPNCTFRPRTRDLRGIRFGRLVVLSFIGYKQFKSGTQQPTWLCKCDCGNETIALAGNLMKHTKSCGCLRHQSPTNKTHGMTKTNEFKIWSKMRERCYNKKDKSYSRYGGRGIKVCDRWLESFSNFFADMGPRSSSKHSIDRINNNGNYEPDNCRWATAKEQANNRRFVKPYTIHGITDSVSGHAKRLGLHKHTLFSRLRMGWSLERAFRSEYRPSST